MSTSPLQPNGVSPTVGDLISELCRWPDHASVSFRCPDTKAELCFSYVDGFANGQIEIVLQPAAETASIAPALNPRLEQEPVAAPPDP